MGGALLWDALQLVPGMPGQARFGLLAIPYAAYAMFAGTRWVLVREIVRGLELVAHPAWLVSESRYEQYTG